MTPTPTPTAALSPEEIYNLLMDGIEPALTTYNLPLLDGMYMDETPEEHEARIATYEKAFVEFDKQYKRYMEGWENYYMSLRKKAESLGRKTREENEKDDTASIEASIQQS